MFGEKICVVILDIVNLNFPSGGSVVKSFYINNLFGISNLYLDADALLLSGTVRSLFVFYRRLLIQFYHFVFFIS